MLVSLDLEHTPGPLDLEGCLVAHSFYGPPKVLDLQEVADEDERQHFSLTEVIL